MTDHAKPVVVDVAAVLARESQAPRAITEQVRGVLEEGAHYVLLNMVNITYADSLVLGAIMQAYASAISRGATLKLLNASYRVRQLLAITKLDKVIQTVDTNRELP